MEKPTQKQIDFATEIAETIGEDLPIGFTKQAYSEFINKNVDYFKQVQNEIRYKGGKVFRLHHAYHAESFEYERISKNPESV